MSAAVTCTSCNRPLHVPETVLGCTVRCPLCLDEFIAQPDPAAAAAAEAAAKETEAAARRAARAAPPPPVTAAAAVRAAEAPPLPPVEEEEEILTALPVAKPAPGGRPPPAPGSAAPGKPQRPGAERPPFVFPVIVSRDPDRILRGRMDAELTAEGLYLRRPRQAPAFTPVGAPARYLGGSRLVVTVEGREVEASIIKPWISVNHLAKDAADFLNGRAALPDPRAYNLPWYLFTLPALAVLLPVVGIWRELLVEGVPGGFLWIFLGAVTAGVTFAVTKMAFLRPRGRLIGAGGLMGLALGGLLLAFILSFILPSPYAIDPTAWKTNQPPSNAYAVSMPGTGYSLPHSTSGNYGMDTLVVDLTPQQCTFKVYTLTPQNGMGGPEENLSSALSNAESTLRNDLTGYNPNNYNYSSYGYNKSLNPRSDKLRKTVSAPGFTNCQEAVYTLQARNERDKAVVARFYVGGGKVYILAAIGPKFTETSDDVKKFFDSFKLAGRALPTYTDFNPPPIAYWSFDQLDPNNWIGDVVSTQDNANHNFGSGWLHSVAKVPDGVKGGAARFNAQNASWFDYGNSADFNFGAGGDFTFAAWVRTSSLSGAVLSQRNGGNERPEINVTIENGCLFGAVRGDNPRGDVPAPVQVRTDKKVNDGRWHHFALVRRSGANIELYIDGEQPQVVSNNPNASGPITTDLRALGSERWLVNKGALGSTNFTGDLDEFYIFKRALNADEIKKLAGASR
jgi:hypothetical protein